MDAIQIQAAAYHEAAHAVVAAAMGADVYACWIDGEGGGECRYRCHRWSEPQELAVRVAGHCAERIWADREDNGVDFFMEGVEAARHFKDEAEAKEVGEEMDDAMAVGFLLRDRDDEQARDALREALSVAQTVLRAKWHDLEAIADCIGV